MGTIARAGRGSLLSELWAVLQYTTYIQRYQHSGGLVQCVANHDEATLSYLADRVEKLIAP